MIIKNFKELAEDKQKKSTLSIIETGLQAAMPENVLENIMQNNCLVVGKRRINLKKHRRVFVVAIGKASYSMTKSVNSLARINGGILVIPKQTGPISLPKKFKILKAGHPIPDAQSVHAAKSVLEFIKKLHPGDFVIFLISGGASSLVALPDGITLKDKQIVTSLLLRSGANIHEINCVRKHLSKIKGGKLMQSLKCTAVSIIMSDVVGDDLSVIASGITYCDKTTFRDARRILERYRLKNSVPKRVWRRICLGINGMIPETPKKEMIKNFVICSNKDCLKAMTKHARKLGFATKIVSCLSGNVQHVARKLVKTLPQKPHCVIFGGESTVIVKGKGLGGRNQELVIHLLNHLHGQKRKTVIVSVGTDGIDGNTDAAGAIIGSDIATDETARFLENNNSYNFFKKYGGLIFTGVTHTNLMDIGLILRQ